MGKINNKRYIVIIKKRMKKILKYIVLYSNNKIEIKEEIKRYLCLIKLILDKVISLELNNRKRLLSRISRLERLNHINDYKLISYNNNKNVMIMKSILSKLIIKLLENVINGVDLKSGGKRVAGGDIIISKPVIKENLNSVNILFYYFIPNNKTSKYLSRVNRYLSKIKNYKELVKSTNGNYSKLNYLSNDKLVGSNILSNIIDNRNNVLFFNKKVNNIVADLNNSDTSLLNILKKSSNHNSSNELGVLPKELLVNSGLWNISILSKKSHEIEEKRNDIKKNIKNMLNNEFLLKRVYKDLNNGVRGLHSKVKLDRKNLVSEFKLKNGLNLGEIKDWDIRKINKENSKGGVYSYMISYVDILLNNIIGSGNKSNDIKLIISKYFGLKEVKIEGIHLKYEFNNPDILLKLIRKGISKRTRTLSRMFRFRLSNRIPLLNEKGILKNKINNNVMKNMLLSNNILNVEKNIRKNWLINQDMGDLNDIKDYNNNIILDSNDLKLNNEILYKNIVGWSLLLKGKVGARKGKNRSNRILMTKGSFKNNNLFINNILENNSKNNGYSKDRLKLNYIKNSNFISYMDKSTNNGKLGITLKVNIL